jgi:hypothetical protein
MENLNSWPYPNSNSDPTVILPVGSRYTDYATVAHFADRVNAEKVNLPLQKDV